MRFPALSLFCCFHFLNFTCTEAFAESEVVASVPDQRESVHSAMKKLLVVLDQIQKYVDGVVDGSEQPMAEYGMKIADAISALQSVRPEEFHSMLQEKIQDLLMVSYISTLAQTQLAISAKINAIL